MASPHFQCWEIIESWKKDCEKRRERPIVFDLTEKNFTPGYLALVTMDYVLARAPNKNKQSQTELLSIGFFPHLISKGSFYKHLTLSRLFF